jgi:hypothetical protein
LSVKLASTVTLVVLVLHGWAVEDVLEVLSVV